LTNVSSNIETHYSRDETERGIAAANGHHFVVHFVVHFVASLRRSADDVSETTK